MLVSSNIINNIFKIQNDLSYQEQSKLQLELEKAINIPTQDDLNQILEFFHKNLKSTVIKML